MGSLFVLVAVTGFCIGWVRLARRNRQRWLARLALPGRWQWQDHQGLLELAGQLDEGRYRLVEPGCDERGSWCLRGHELVLRPSDGGSVSELDLRFFEDGKIGIHGPGREARIYLKQRGNNVVALRRPA